MRRRILQEPVGIVFNDDDIELDGEFVDLLPTLY